MTGALDDDYRLSALWAIATPVFQASAGIRRNNFERTHLAVEHLGRRASLA